MKDYKIYIFDLDLTAVDSVEASKVCYKHAFEAIGLEFDESKTHFYLNINLKELYFEVESKAPNCGMKFFNAFVEKSSTAFAEFGRFYDDAKVVFETLANRGAKIAIFTNRGKVEIKSILDANPDVKKNISYFVGSDMVKEMKPSPEGIIKCLDEFGFSKEDALYVGDSPCDYEASCAAGCDFFYIDRFKNKATPAESHDTLEDMIK